MGAYFTEQGDTWDLIAYKLYGSELQIPPLLDANPALMDVVVFASGQQVIVPKLSADSRNAKDTPPWRNADG